MPIQMLPANIFGTMGKEKPSRQPRKGALVQRKFDVTSSALVQLLYPPYKSQVTYTSVFMLGAHECCLV